MALEELQGYLNIENIARLKEQILGLGKYYESGLLTVPSTGDLTVSNIELPEGKHKEDIVKVFLKAEDKGILEYQDVTAGLVRVSDTEIKIGESAIPSGAKGSGDGVILIQGYGADGAITNYIRLKTKDTWNKQDTAILAPLGSRNVTLKADEAQVLEPTANELGLFKVNIPSVNSVLQSALGSDSSPAFTITSDGKQELDLNDVAFTSGKFGLTKTAKIYVNVDMATETKELILSKSGEAVTGKIVAKWSGLPGSWRASVSDPDILGYSTVTVPSVSVFLNSDHRTEANAIPIYEQVSVLSADEAEAGGGYKNGIWGYENGTYVKVQDAVMSASAKVDNLSYEYDEDEEVYNISGGANIVVGKPETTGKDGWYTGGTYNNAASVETTVAKMVINDEPDYDDTNHKTKFGVETAGYLDSEQIALELDTYNGEFAD